jgi:hypothetical protein
MDTFCLQLMGKHKRSNMQPFEVHMDILNDYSIWGRELEGMNLFDFMLNTHEGSRWKHKNGNVVFINYLASSYKESKGRIIWNNDDEVVPEMFGWPPLLHRYKDKELYEGCILLLFNPWRDIQQTSCRKFGGCAPLGMCTRASVGRLWNLKRSCRAR